MRLLPFVFGMLGERLCPSKARGNFEKTAKEKHQQNSLASLVGRPLTDRALLSRFGCAERQRNVQKQYLFRWDFLPARWETDGKHYTPRACSPLP